MAILIAVNGNEQKATAVTWGRLLIQITGSAPTLVTVIKHEAERPQRQALLESAAQMLNDTVPVIPIKIATGRITEEIVRETETGHYDLLVVGLRPFPPFIKHFLGSGIERILQQTACPVLIAKNRPTSLRRILICEGGRAPTLLKRLITQLPALITNGTEIKVLHVMSQILVDPAKVGWELQADASTLIEKHTPEGELLQQDVQLLAVGPVPVETQVRHGLVVNEILTEARNGRYDLIVIGRHQGSGWWLADLMNQIVTQADRSVMVI